MMMSMNGDEKSDDDVFDDDYQIFNRKILFLNLFLFSQIFPQEI